MNDELRKSIVAYLRDEFEMASKEANEEARHRLVFMAHTQLEDVDRKEHDLDVALEIPKHAITYCIDDVEVAEVVAPTPEELAYEVDCHTFDDWIFDCQMYSGIEWYE